MATLKISLTLKHRGNLGLDTEAFCFEAGTEFTILNEWEEHYLCKDSEGNVFNIAKEHVDAG